LKIVFGLTAQTHTYQKIQAVLKHSCKLI